MVFGPSALNRVYNFKRVCPGPILDRVIGCRTVLECLAIQNQRSLSVIYFSELEIRDSQNLAKLGLGGKPS